MSDRAHTALALVLLLFLVALASFSGFVFYSTFWDTHRQPSTPPEAPDPWRAHPVPSGSDYGRVQVWRDPGTGREYLVLRSGSTVMIPRER